MKTDPPIQIYGAILGYFIAPKISDFTLRFYHCHDGRIRDCLNMAVCPGSRQRLRRHASVPVVESFWHFLVARTGAWG